MTIPVVLIHGYMATPALLTPMKVRLEQRGFLCRTVDLSPFAIQDVRELAAQLAMNVDRILREEGAERVDLVGVSQGGFIALHYMQALDGAKTARRFASVGTPFGGTWVAAVGLPLLGGISKGIWQVLPNSKFLEDMRAQGLPEGVPGLTIAQAGDPVAPPERSELKGARSIVLDGGFNPIAHQKLVLGSASVDAMAEFFSEAE